MYREITTEQLEHTVNLMIRSRNEQFDPSAFNLAFPTEVAECNGPDRAVVFRYHTYPWMQNLNGVVHGGIAATILDVSMATLSISLYGVITPTVSMTINYTRPIPLDADILVKVHATYTGESSAQLTACMYLPGEERLPLATASGVYHAAGAGKKTAKAQAFRREAEKAG